MTIKFSRHAKRRAKLYRLSLPTIENILKKKNLHPGKHEMRPLQNPAILFVLASLR